jgi:metal-responsive CopG/Arc/MetJ family transcriptional regulator
MQSRTKIPENKVNVGIKLDCHLLLRIKKLAAREGRTISDIIQDVLIKYIDADTLKSELRRVAVTCFCSRPFNLNTREIKELQNKDLFE